MEKKKRDEDKLAILARREAFLKKVLSKEEKSSVAGGSGPLICLSIEPGICLSLDN
ncbi:MAG: hypothetical protein GY757_21140 [bacterium]|nr:hypothetical protein [bacterium]